MRSHEKERQKIENLKTSLSSLFDGPTVENNKPSADERASSAFREIQTILNSIEIDDDEIDTASRGVDFNAQDGTFNAR